MDGAGKSTALALVAERMRQRGEHVFLPRLGKDHSSRPVRKIRDLTRDRRNVELDARAELLLYCAREAQLLSELVEPALTRGATVLIDRSLLTPTVLGLARGLPREDCERAARSAGAGLEPDLTLVFDVHPRTARIRKRLERIRTHSREEGGRKGLSGSAFKERVRAFYGKLASEQRFPVLHCERASPHELAERALACIDGAPVPESDVDRTPLWQVAPDWDLGRALASLPIPIALFLGNGLIATRELRRRALQEEPALCAFTLDFEDPLRETLCELEPEYALRGSARWPFAGPEDLRLRLLERAPEACLPGLKRVHDAQTDALRARYAEKYPDAVLASLGERQDPTARELRERCWPEASDDTQASCLVRRGDEEAWQLREELLERNPVVGLLSLRGLCDARTDELLERYAERAPKVVLDVLGARSDPASFSLRERLFETGREVIESVRGLSGEAAFALRERGLPRWPSTVAHSLLGLPDEPRVRSLLERCAALGAGDVHVLRRLQRVAEWPSWPAWARAKSEDLGEDDAYDD
jgi:dTMP kinase